MRYAANCNGKVFKKMQYLIKFVIRFFTAIKLNSSKVEIPTDSDISDNAASAIRGFLNADPATRLGTGGSLQEHPFFQKVNWEQVCF